MNRRSIIRKAVSANHRPYQMGLAVFGCIVGFFLILTSVQSVVNFESLLSGSGGGIGAQYMVINKKVGLLNTVNIAKTYFSQSQLEEIASHPSIEKWSPFTGNEFEAQAYLEMRNTPQQFELKTDLFLESVDDAFMDVDPDRWNWEGPRDEIPVILPTDFINLYNFTYAPARGLPQISKGTVRLFGFSISIRGNGKQETFKASIAGFSDRISSMVVPIRFMEYANDRFGEPSRQKKNAVYRVIVAIKPSQLSAFREFLEENDYETNQELLRNGRFASLMYLLVSVILAMGILISVNAFTGFVLYFQLLISRSKGEIDSLLRLGYGHSQLVKSYLYSVARILGMVAAIAISGQCLMQWQLSRYLERFQFNVPVYIHPYPIVAMTLVGLTLALVFYWQIRAEILQIALPAKREACRKPPSSA